jgi:hypothetical protein
MGIMRWLRGGEENGAAASVISAGLAEIDGLFRPSKHKQTEHVEESKRKRVDVANGAGIDLDRGFAVIRPTESSGEATPRPPRVRAPRPAPRRKPRRKAR